MNPNDDLKDSAAEDLEEMRLDAEHDIVDFEHHAQQAADGRTVLNLRPAGYEKLDDLTDTLCSLMHASLSLELDFEEALARAYMHYRTEISGVEDEA